MPPCGSLSDAIRPSADPKEKPPLDLRSEHVHAAARTRSPPLHVSAHFPPCPLRFHSVACSLCCLLSLSSSALLPLLPRLLRSPLFLSCLPCSPPLLLLLASARSLSRSSPRHQLMARSDLSRGWQMFACLLSDCIVFCRNHCLLQHSLPPLPFPHTSLPQIATIS